MTRHCRTHGTMHWQNIRFAVTFVCSQCQCADRKVKKYHSMAAKGESIDVSELAKNERFDAGEEDAMKTQEASPSNDMASQNIEQPQMTTGAESTKKSTVTEPSLAAAHSASADASRSPAVGGAMPHALLYTGNPHWY